MQLLLLKVTPKIRQVGGRYPRLNRRIRRHDAHQGFQRSDVPYVTAPFSVSVRSLGINFSDAAALAPVLIRKLTGSNSPRAAERCRVLADDTTGTTVGRIGSDEIGSTAVIRMDGNLEAAAVSPANAARGVDAAHAVATSATSPGTTPRHRKTDPLSSIHLILWKRLPRGEPRCTAAMVDQNAKDATHRLVPTPSPPTATTSCGMW